MRIALATQHADRNFIPLALLHLKAAVVGRGCARADEVAVLEFQSDATPEAIADALVHQCPDLIGLSCYVWNIKTTMAAATLLKQRLPAARIVLGGPEVGPLAADVMRAHSCADVVVHSEGEVPFADIVEAWQRGEGLGGVA